MKYKGNLKVIHLENLLVKNIVEIIQNDFPQLVGIKGNIELVNVICNAIEDGVKYSSVKKVDKLSLFIKIYEGIFGRVSEEDKTQVIQMVNYLDSHGKIKARSLLKYLFDNIMLFLKLKE